MVLPDGWVLSPDKIVDFAPREDLELADVERWNGYHIYSLDSWGVFVFKAGAQVLWALPGLTGADDDETIAAVVEAAKVELAAREAAALQLPIGNITPDLES